MSRDLASARPLPARSLERSGGGTIGRGMAWILTVAFVSSICAPTGYQYWFEAHVLGRSRLNDLLERWPTRDSLRQFEMDLTDQSRFDRWVRHSFWNETTGGSKPPGWILTGYDGFLFHQSELAIYNQDSLTALPPSPTATILPAIMDFDGQLRRRGIHLVLLPIPLRLSIYPEKLAFDYRDADGPALPPGYARWMAKVRAAGIDLIDLTQPFWQAKQGSSEPIFWPTDTHWSYHGRQIADDVVAGHLRGFAAAMPRAVFDVTITDIDAEGDLAGVLSRGWGNTKYPHNRYSPKRLMREGKPFVAGNEARILLMGDSFTVYSSAEGCGFPDDLMLRLQTEIQVIGVLGEPINGPRLALADHPEILAEKKLVVWEFSADFMWKPWQMVQLK